MDLSLIKAVSPVIRGGRGGLFLAGAACSAFNGDGGDEARLLGLKEEAMAKKKSITNKKPTTKVAPAPAHIQNRIAALQRRIRSWGCDALVVSNARDMRYLTGFVGENSWAIVRARSKKTYILSDGRFKDQIPIEAPHAIALIRHTETLEELTADIVAKHKVNKVALQADYLRVSERKRIAKQIGARRVVDVDDGLIEQRSVKDATEIASIRKAIAIQQQVFLRTREYVRPGMTELEIAAYLEYQARILGADGMSFSTIVAADANAGIPHYMPGLDKVKEGGIVLIDWGVKYEGYCSDMTRVLALGEMPAKIRELHAVVREAYRAGIEAIKPGANLKAVDKAARDVIVEAGYGEHYQHGLGHGIGLDIHEEPRIGFRKDGELLANQVVTVEPGIYLKGIGGVRLEDDVLVTETGHEVLCDLPMDAEWAVIDGENGRSAEPGDKQRDVDGEAMTEGELVTESSGVTS